MFADTWSQFLDFPKLPEWSQGFIKSIEVQPNKDAIEKGDKLHVVMEGMAFSPTVVVRTYDLPHPPSCPLVFLFHPPYSRHPSIGELKPGIPLAGVIVRSLCRGALVPLRTEQDGPGIDDSDPVGRLLGRAGLSDEPDVRLGQEDAG